MFCPANIDNNHWILVRLDINSPRVHVYSSTTLVDYVHKFQYMLNMILKLIISCEYLALKLGFILRDKWDFKVKESLQ